MLRVFTTFVQKKFFFTLTLVVAVIALLYPQNAFAQYENYKNLFTRDSGISLFTGSGQNSWAVTSPSYTEGISGFRFNIKLEFAPFGGEPATLTEAQLERKWDYVSNIENGTNRVFIIRVCEVTTAGALNEDSCYIKEVPFTEYGVLNAAGNFIGVSQNTTGAGSLRDSVSTALIPNTYRYPGIFEKRYGMINGVNNPWLRSITIPFITTQSDSDWFWFKKNTQGNFVRDTPPQIPFTTRNLKADLWYCAGPAGRNAANTGPEDGTTAAVDGNLIQRFPGLCGGTSYFKIGNTIDITLPASLQQIGSQETANTELSNTNTQVATGARNSNLPGCSFIGNGGTWIGCIAQLLYHILYRPMAWFATMVGMLFDFFLGFSINDEAYRLAFIQNGWQIVRDFANIFFIIIMIYAGFSVALGFGKYSLKSVVVALIINALIINFSLFITRLGVDMSNILARVFYNQMTVDTTETAPGGYKPISVALISTFNPQKLMEADILNQDASSLSSGGDGNRADVNFNASAEALERKIKTQDSDEYASFFAIVSITSALVLFFVAKMFFTVAFVFVGRVVGLYMAMIFSPLAFLTRGDIPLLGTIGKINFNEWFKNYQKDLYLPPIFMFFLYIIGYLLSTSLAGLIGLSSGTTFFEKVISVGIPMIIVYMLIAKAKGIAETFASETAKLVTQKIEGAGKFIGGLALGGAVGVGAGAIAMGGRGVGAVASKVQKSEFGNKLITANLDKTGIGGSMARLANKGLTGAQNNSFDLRDNKAFTSTLAKFGNQFGMKPATNNAVLGALNLNKEDSKGGYAGMQKKREEEIKKKAERIQTNFDDTEEGKNAAKENYRQIQREEHLKEENIKEKKREKLEEEKKVLNDKKVAQNFSKNELENARKQLEEKKKTDSTIVVDDTSIKSMALENVSDKIKEKEKEIVESQTKTFEEFQKEQESQFGKVKDNKSLTQALRLRYAQNMANNPEQNAWDTVRAGAMMLGGTMIGGPLGFAAATAVVGQDILKGVEQRKAAAEKFMKDSQKTFKADQKKAQELDTAVNTVNDHLKQYAEGLKNSSVPADVQKYEDRYKKALKQKNGIDYYDHEALDEYEHFEEAYQDQIIDLESEIKVLDDEFKKATGADKKKKAKEFAQATAKRDKLKSARTKIENARKEKEKKDGDKKDGDKKDEKK